MPWWAWVLMIVVLAFVVCYWGMTEEWWSGTDYCDFRLKPGIGPMVRLSFEGNGEAHDALLDTGSLFLMTTFRGTRCLKRFPSGTQTYHYAGPSAQFEWECQEPVLGTLPLGPVPVGFTSSQKALGLPAVVGLAPLPRWASQRFRMPSLVDYLGVRELWFDFAHSRLYWQRGARGKHVLIAVPTVPLALPTPGLGYVSTAVQRLVVRTHGGSLHYEIGRTAAPNSSAQSWQFWYRELPGGTQTSLPWTEWYCLFDTGTYPGVFYANGAADLLGSRVTQSMVANQDAASDFVTGTVSYTFATQTLTASAVTVPTLSPSSLSQLPSLLCVCGTSFQQHFEVGYCIGETSRLPEKVVFCETASD